MNKQRVEHPVEDPIQNGILRNTRILVNLFLVFLSVTVGNIFFGIAYAIVIPGEYYYREEIRICVLWWFIGVALFWIIGGFVRYQNKIRQYYSIFKEIAKSSENPIRNAEK